MMTEKMIKALENKGFKRWTKGDHDRLYANPQNFGLEVEFYKSGYVFYAELNGEKISNNAANEIMRSTVYIDVKTGKIFASPHIHSDYMDNINAAIAEAEQEAAEAEQNEPEEVK